ncbi:hypothetical protein NE612_06380 [Oscillibacter valericigenes]|nr:hypothetical protein [Oscillibacter valericigenes]
MRIVELFEIGFFTSFWNWKVPILTVAIYFFVLIGATFQIILQKKRCIPKMEWFLIVLCVICILLFEYLGRIIPGFDSLNATIYYGFLICVFLGAAIIKIATTLFRSQKK